MKSTLPLLASAIGLAIASLAQAAEPAWVATKTGAHDDVVFASGAHAAVAEDVAPGQALHVVVSLQLRGRAELDARIARIQAGHTSEIIGTEQLMAQHMPTAEQAQAVADYLHDAGFRNIEIAGNRLLVSADGSVGMATKAFHTQLHHVDIEGQRYFSNASAAQVPEALGGIVLAVHGLQNVSSFHTMAKPLGKPTPAPTAGGIVGHKPTDFPLIYNASSLPAATGATIGIISDGVMTQTLKDLNQFTAGAGLPTANVLVKNVGAVGTDTSGTPEWDLDSQDALAAAGGQLKQIIFYTATSLADGPLTQAYNQAVTDKVASVVNVSLGECETSAKTSGVLAADDQIFAVAMAQGQTFTVSSGDSGSHECSKRANNGSYPAVSPYVMAIGGTTVSTSGTTTYVSESTWSGAGGSPSTTEPAPSWQKSSGVLGSSTMRGVPDISFDADPASGSIIIVNGANAQYGGTSLAAPLFAGFWARIQAANGTPQKFPDPSIYKYGVANPSLFHDVTTGSNGGYTAKAGWDYATGFGSVDILALKNFIASTSGF